MTLDLARSPATVAVGANSFDQFAKRLAREGLSPAGCVETEAEVTPNALRIDVWFIPYAGRAPRKALAPLGLLGRMARTSCTIEPFHRMPSAPRVSPPRSAPGILV